MSAETVTYADFEAMQGDLATLSTTVNDQQALVAKLSDDIGTMAERIGVMADRIVDTETQLGQALILLVNNPDFAGTSSSNGVALVSPVDDTVLSKLIPPELSMTPASSSYLIYVSTTPTFAQTETISLYVDSSTALASKWSQVVDFAGASTVYIGVKRIEGSVISSISNGVKVTIQ